MTTNQWISKQTTSLVGKTVAITGATGGLGGALTEHLATLGADLILLDRNQKKSEALENKLLTSHPTVKIVRIPVDMEDFDSVKAATNALLSQKPDYLILNAGAYHIPRHKTAIGYDNVFQINCIAPYYMARKLKDTIKERGGRIVAVGSIAHNYSKTDPEDVDFSRREKPSLVYGNAKRHLMYALADLFKGDDTLAITHPGITFTNITAHYPKLIFALIKHPMKIIFMSPKKAGLCILFCVFNSCKRNEWIGPRLFNIWGRPKKKTLNTCSDTEAAQICEIADQAYEKMCNI